MSAYLALAVAGFRRQASEALVTISGIVTNAFFGLVRAAVFFAVYAASPHAAGLDLAKALTYVWVSEALFTVLYTPWNWDYATRIRSGDLVIDLTRPTDALGGLFAFDVGRNLAQLLIRSLPLVVVTMLVLPMAHPTTVAGWLLVPVTAALVPIISFEIRFLQESTAFVTADYRGIGRLLLFPIQLMAGMIIPIEFFPGPLRWVAEASPLFAVVTAPVRVLQGHGATAAVIVQLAWAVVLWLICRWVFSSAVRRMVIHGG